MNNTEKILDIIGLKVGEVFRISTVKESYYFDCKLNLYNEKHETQLPITARRILNGDCEITKIPQLTDNDKEILAFYSKRGYKWFVEDANEEQWAFKNKPFKNDDMGFWNTDSEEIDSNELVDKLSFIFWEDAEPYYYEGKNENIKSDCR